MTDSRTSRDGTQRKFNAEHHWVHACYFGGTRVTDLTPLRGMPLAEVDFNRTDVTDVSPLLGCPTLLRVLVSRSTSNVGLLTKLPNLTSISARWDPEKKAPFHATTAEFWTEWDKTHKSGQ